MMIITKAVKIARSGKQGRDRFPVTSSRRASTSLLNRHSLTSAVGLAISAEHTRAAAVKLCFHPKAGQWRGEDFSPSTFTKEIIRKERSSRELISSPSSNPRGQIRRSVEQWIGRAIYAVNQQKVRSFARLPKGWNSYDAEAPGEVAIALAIRFIDLLKKYTVKINWVAPSVDDSVMMTVNARSGSQEWEFFGNGGTAVMYRDEQGEKQYVDLEEADFEKLLTR